MVVALVFGALEQVSGCGVECLYTLCFSYITLVRSHIRID